MCSSSVKNAIGILIGIALNLCMALGSMDILKIFSLNHEHNMSFHLFVLSSVSLVKSCSFKVEVFHLLG